MTLAPEDPNLVQGADTSQKTSEDAKSGDSRHVRRLRLLHDATLAFSGTLALEQVLRQVLEKTQELLHALGWAIWLVDPATGDLICADVAGPDAQSVQGYHLPADQGIVSTVVQSGTSVYVSDLTTDPRSVNDLTDNLHIPVRSLLCAPLPTESGIVGALVLVDRAADAYSDGDRALLDALAASAAMAIKNAQLYERAQAEIEERRRTAVALRQSETHYRTLVETSPEAIIVTDLEGKVALCNHRALMLCGFDLRSELLGRSIFTLFPAPAIPEARAHYREVLDGAPLSRIETTLKRRDGAAFDAEWSASLIADGHGDPAGVVSFARDISDRKRADEALRRRNEELHVLYTMVTELSRSPNPKHALATVLDETLKALGTTTGWLSLSSWEYQEPEPGDTLEVYHGFLAAPDVKSKSRTAADVARLSATVRESQTLELAHSPWLCETRGRSNPGCPVAVIPIVVRGDVIGELGVVRPAQLSATAAVPFDDHDRELLSAIGRQIAVAADSARLRQAVAEAKVLRELNRLRAELIADFSHDLRTPLGIIDMAASTLQREGDDLDLSPEMRNDFLLDIEEQVRRLNVLIQDILDVGRLESSQLTIETRTLDLGRLIKVVAGSMQRTKPQHRFIVKLPDEPVMILADRSRVQQILYNLLDNAVKYSPDGGDILIEAARVDAKIRVSVSDQGIGISSDQLDVIFERFYRVKSEATQHIDGEGLGLSTARSIVEGHGGTIWVESEPGQGSTFVFTLPVSEPHPTDIE